MKVWQCVVWLSAITLEVARSQSPDREGWIREAVDLYNQREDGEFLFKLLSELPAALLEEEGDSPAITFLIKETDCPKSEEKDLEGCDYKEDGEVKVCALQREEEDVKCVSLAEKSRSKRSSKKKCNFLCKVKNRLKSLSSTSVIAAGVPRGTYRG
ncbi:cathelicidin antimicrobial peptide-like isoform X2 [Rana temporaria]|uniref:cathelicidin antimicrobial peptide-like isoform X2 n=1 Tax=Rana temporaria TaxID=8407 RepID=UPI001AACEA6D|nr:cathelicidin antimicrobial peptide-like isoform X2 [Rana temporaria]